MFANESSTIPAPDDTALRQDLAEKAAGLFATNCVGIAGFTMLVWDHVITFGDEVAVIWNRPPGHKNGLLIYLFLILRYFAPIAYVVQLCSYFLPSSTWTNEICAHYVVFEGAVIVASLGIVALMMMIRVYALYAKDKRVLAFVVALFVLQFSIQGWLLGHTHPVQHPSGFHIAGCSMLFDDSLGVWPTASAWLPVVYDTAIFVLTVCKTAYVLKRRGARPSHGNWIARTLLRDGALYYFAIIASNVPLIIMIAAAPDGIRNIAAQLECFVTVTMMSRITLSLRREDAAWQVGSVVSEHAGGQTTIHFAGLADGDLEMKKRGADADDADGTASVASTSTLVSNSCNSGTWRGLRGIALPTPIVENQEEDAEDYFHCAPSPCGDGMFRPYSHESSQTALASRASGSSNESFRPLSPCSPTWALTSPRRRVR